MIGTGFVPDDHVDHGGHIGADGLRLGLQLFDGHVGIVAVMGWHMRPDGGGPAIPRTCALMAGHAPTAVKGFDGV